MLGKGYGFTALSGMKMRTPVKDLEVEEIITKDQSATRSANFQNQPRGGAGFGNGATIPFLTVIFLDFR